MNALPATDKAAIRKQVRQALGALSAEERRLGSLSIGSQIRESEVWRKAGNVLMFSPLPDEPDIWPLAELALTQGKLLALPRFIAGEDRYEAARVESLEEDLTTGAFGVREPLARCPSVPLKPLDLLLVPGVAFEAGGRRLGRGKGYYDRLLAGTGGCKLGVAFDCQVVEMLPLEPHDVVLNCIVTPARWLPAGGGRAV
jgi:5-formyltetrahydrofolate cyclo-ligase